MRFLIPIFLILSLVPSEVPASDSCFSLKIKEYFYRVGAGRKVTFYFKKVHGGTLPGPLEFHPHRNEQLLRFLEAAFNNRTRIELCIHTHRPKVAELFKNGSTISELAIYSISATH